MMRNQYNIYNIIKQWCSCRIYSELTLYYTVYTVLHLMVLLFWYFIYTYFDVDIFNLELDIKATHFLFKVLLSI